MKIGVLCESFVRWAGGVDFIRMLVGSLTALDNRELEIHVLIPDRGPIFSIRNEIAARIRGQLRSSVANQNGSVISEIPNDDDNRVTFHHIDAGRRALYSICRRLQIDAIVPAAGSLGRTFPIPWVGYIYDFQHKYFPQYFSSLERVRRDVVFRRMVRDARAVIVNSRAAAADASKYLGETSAEIVALPFSAAPNEEWFTDRAGTREQYGISKRYFLISNQFWLHKRHDIAFAAFRDLSREDPSVQLVCTGQTKDFRDPKYFSRLTAYLQANGLSDAVKILGLIPKRDQIELMKGSIAVVQPTSFEGGPGGGSVYDAISLGVPTIVSDIPINREIEKWVTSYFPLNDAIALYSAMRVMTQGAPSRIDPESLLERGRERQRSCGDVLLATLNKHLR